MKYALYLPLFALLFALGCDDDDVLSTQEVDFPIAFRAEFGGTPLAIQSADYAYPTGADLKIQLFQYYVSDLELLPADGGDPVQLSDIELIRWMSATEAATTTRTFQAPIGDYVGLRFGVGVSPDLNAQDPSNFAADYVLNENEFWGPSTRYVFAKIEANADLENDGTFDTPLTYHLGSDALYTTVTFDRTFTLDGTQDPDFTIVADVLKALADDADSFDIANPDQQRVHGGNQAIATDLWNRLADQFSLETR